MPLAARRVPLVGRERELAFLLERLDDARSDAGGVILIAGEPGIGKTRLLAEFTDRARADGWQLLAGHAYEHEGLPPYFPVIEALRDYIRGCPLPQLRRELGPGAAELAALVPQLRDRLPGLPPADPVSPETGRYLLYDRISEFLAAIARTAPTGLLLVLDDLHWADSATMLLLQHLVRQHDAAPRLIVATYRTVDAGPSTALPDLLADLQRLEGLTRLTLTPLGFTAATALISGISGVTAAAPVVAALLRETAGNPFFLGEVVRSLLADGRDLSDHTALVAHQGVPEGVRQVIGRRLARLSAATNAVLQAAAVLGDGFAADLLRASTASTYDAQEVAVDEAVTAGLLRERGEEYEFGHPLMREVVYAGLRLPRRQQLHAAAVAAIERVHAANLTPYSAELATHARLAGPAIAAERTLTYTVRAAQAAAAVFAWEEAARHWRLALDLLEKSQATSEMERCDALIALGVALYLGGDIPDSQAAYARAAILAQHAGLPERMAQAALGHGEPGRTPSQQDQRSIDLLEQSLSVLADRDSIMRARLLSLLSEHLPHSGPEGERKLALNAEAIAMARRLGDPATLVFTLNDWQYAWCTWALPAERLAVAAEMVQLGTAAGDREALLKGLRWRIGVFFALGDLASLDRDIALYGRVAEELRAPPHLRTAILLRALRAGLEGRFDGVEALVEQRPSPEYRVNDGDVSYHFSQHGRQFALERASPAACRALLVEQARVATPLVSSHPAWRSILVWTLLQLERPEEARQQYALLAAHDFADLPADVVWLLSMARLVELCAAFGDQRRAALLYQRLLPYQGLFGALPGPAYPCYGAIDQYLGMLAAMLSNWQQASLHFEAALALCTRLGARPFLAQTQCAYAALYRDRHASGDEARATSLLQQALTTYRELGMAFSATRAATMLAALAPPVHATDLPATLSPREVEVLRLLARGKSNPEIAKVLVISLFTVYRHVNHILAKTGCSNRVEAATYAHRHGIAS